MRIMPIWCGGVWVVSYGLLKFSGDKVRYSSRVGSGGRGE